MSAAWQSKHIAACVVVWNRFSITGLQFKHVGPDQLEVVLLLLLRVAATIECDHKFVAKCASAPGHAADCGGGRKLSSQYKCRLPGGLVPLTAETWGRWIASVPPLVRALAREYVQRSPGLDDDDVHGAVVARWGARLSALLIRGNGAVVRASMALPEVTPHVDFPGNPGLHHIVPEGDCAYELLVQ